MVINKFFKAFILLTFTLDPNPVLAFIFDDVIEWSSIRVLFWGQVDLQLVALWQVHVRLTSGGATDAHGFSWPHLADDGILLTSLEHVE